MTGSGAGGGGGGGGGVARGAGGGAGGSVVVSGSRLSGGGVVVVVLVVLVVVVDVVVDGVAFDDAVTWSVGDESPPVNSTAEADTTAMAATRPPPTATRRTLTDPIPHPSCCQPFGGESARRTVALNESVDSWRNAYPRVRRLQCSGSGFGTIRTTSASSARCPACAR